MRTIISTLSLLFFPNGVNLFFLITIVATLMNPGISLGSGTESTIFLTIDNEEYTGKDFRQWWEYWQEEDSVFPDTPNSFIEWQLLSREALGMELDREPSFRRKVEVFLKARTLMLLKNEAIDKHLTATENELEEMYNEKYSPRWQTAIFYFRELNIAKQVAKLLRGKGGKDLQGLVAKLPGVNISYSTEKLYRPINIPDNWREDFLKLQEGEAGPPMSMGEGYVVIYLFSKKTSSIKNDSEDYYDQRDTIKKRLIKQKQARYTDELIRSLIKKYKVHIDEELLVDIDIINPQEELLNKKLITTAKGDVTVSAFLENIKRNQRVRKQNLTDKKAQMAEKWSVARGIISQSVTTWESLDRHYEEKDPFKVIYQLYRQHRLLKELDRMVFQKNITIKQGDIVAYYNKNIADFTAEPTISYSQVRGDYSQIKTIWAKSLSSGNMSDNAVKEGLVVKQHNGVVQARVEPDIGRILAGLNPDEMSMPVKMGGGGVLLHLLARQIVGDKLPLSKVHKKIRRELGRQAVRTAKKKFVGELKVRSTIRLKQKVWQEIKKELTKN